MPVDAADRFRAGFTMVFLQTKSFSGGAYTTETLANQAPRVLALILASLGLRLLFAGSLGLGVDESYTIATGRHLALSAYDHPPLAWWLSRGAAVLFGSEAALAVRAPFVLLFCVTTWQIYRLGSLLFGERAGFLASLLLNCAPVLGVTTATWVLPDGPLDLALVSGALCLARVLLIDGTRPSLWLAAGFWCGLALLSKYHGVFLFAGTGLFLLTSPRHRRWLASPWPYAGGALAALMFAPVIVWNIQHDWASFAFQSGRAVSKGIRPWMPLVVLAGQALFLFPWLWLGLVVSAVRAARAGAGDERRWLLFCLGAGPVATFTILSIWSQSLYFHWAMPGYLLWVPLLAADLSQGASWTKRVWTHALAGTAGLAALLVAGLSLVAVAPVDWGRLHLADPLADTRDLTDVHAILAARGVEETPGLFVAARRWYDAGRLDYALGGSLPVTCLCADARGYGVLAPLGEFAGKDAVIFVSPRFAAHIETYIKGRFDRLERLEDATFYHGTQSFAVFAVFRGHRFLPPDAVSRLDALE